MRRKIEHSRLTSHCLCKWEKLLAGTFRYSLVLPLGAVVCFLAKPVFVRRLGDTFLTSDPGELSGNHQLLILEEGDWLPRRERGGQKQPLEWPDSAWCQWQDDTTGFLESKGPSENSAPLGLVGFQKFHWALVAYFSSALGQLKTGFILTHR